MSKRDRIDQRRDWVLFLSTAIVSLLIWEVLYYFVFYGFSLKSERILNLAMPFMAASLMAYIFVWRRQKGLLTKIFSVLVAALLVVVIRVAIGAVYIMTLPGVMVLR